MLSLRQLEGRKTALDAAEDEHEHEHEHEHELCCCCCCPRRIVNAEGTPRRKTLPPNNKVVVVMVLMFCLFSLSLKSAFVMKSFVVCWGKSDANALIHFHTI
jgi:hypothetical protein